MVVWQAEQIASKDGDHRAGEAGEREPFVLRLGPDMLTSIASNQKVGDAISRGLS
jgi:hypothetical protein